MKSGMGNGTEDTDVVGEGSEELIKSSEESSEDWMVECSDEESYNPTGQKGNIWEPKPEDIKTLYQRLSSGENLELDWMCPGRRSPSPEKLDDDTADLKDEPEEEKEEERILPKGFDFDEDMDSGGIKPGSGFTPRRTPGSAQTPRSQKRVARMDKIMNDILRHKKIEAAERKHTPGRRLHQNPVGQRKPGAFATSQRRLLTQSGGDKKTEKPSSLDPKPPVVPTLAPTPRISEDRSTTVGPESEKQPVSLPVECSADDPGTVPVDKPTETSETPTDVKEDTSTNVTAVSDIDSVPKAAEPANMPPHAPVESSLDNPTNTVTTKMESLTCEPPVQEVEAAESSAAHTAATVSATPDAKPSATCVTEEPPAETKMEVAAPSEPQPYQAPPIPTTTGQAGVTETTTEPSKSSPDMVETSVIPETPEGMDTEHTPLQPPASGAPPSSGEKMDT